jgi:hypothetical protein
MIEPNMLKLIDISSRRNSRQIIEVSFVKSKDQLADVLTKAVTGKVFHNSLSKLGMSNIYTPT